MNSKGPLSDSCAWTISFKQIKYLGPSRRDTPVRFATKRAASLLSVRTKGRAKAKASTNSSKDNDVNDDPGPSPFALP